MPAHLESSESSGKPAVGVPRGRKGWVPMPLLGRVAVVTGSSQGIGAGIASELAHAGADVCINYVGDRAPAENVAEQIRKIGRRVIIVEANMAHRSEIERMFEDVEQELGPVSILVTNAITSKRDNILDTKIEDFENTMNIGLYGVFHCMQIFSRKIVARHPDQQGSNGSIVHICSPHATGPFKDAIDYNVTKAAAHHLAISAANELMWHGIRVNIVQPGWTVTEGERRLYSEEVLQKSAETMPLGRLGAPEDVGKACVWLCSDEAAYITGATLRADGGQFIETAPSWASSGRHN